MLKKASVKPFSQVRSSDRRRLADEAAELFQLDRAEPAAAGPAEPSSPYTPALLRSLLFPASLQSAKFATATVAGTVYAAGPGRRVLWIRIEKDKSAAGGMSQKKKSRAGELVPAVSAVWIHRIFCALAAGASAGAAAAGDDAGGLLPLLYTHGPIIPKLLAGAALMVPGLVGERTYPIGTVVAVQEHVEERTDPRQVPAPVLVGRWVAGEEELAKGHGHAVEGITGVGDWEEGTFEDLWKEVEADVRKAEEVARREREAREGGGEGEEEEKEGAGGMVSETVGEPSGGAQGLAQEPVEQPEGITQKDLDATFHTLFLVALAGPDVKTPMSQSAAIELVSTLLPDEVALKKTSWKTAKKFLKQVAKEGAIKIKEGKDEVTILDVDAAAVEQASAEYQQRKRLGAAKSGGAAAASGGKKTTAKTAGERTVSVTIVYRLPSSFVCLGLTAGTRSDIQTAIGAYVSEHGLDAGQGMVTLDPHLGALPLTSPVGRAKLVEAVLGICKTEHVVHPVLSGAAAAGGAGAGAGKAGVVGPAAAAALGAGKSFKTAPRLALKTENRRNKNVTSLRGPAGIWAALGLDGTAPEEIAAELKRACAASAGVERMVAGSAGGKGEWEVTVQGSRVREVLECLAKRGVREEWVEQAKKEKGKK